jgi:hypothetical protein
MSQLFLLWGGRALRARFRPLCQFTIQQLLREIIIVGINNLISQRSETS